MSFDQTITNTTPYTWYWSTKEDERGQKLEGNSKTSAKSIFFLTVPFAPLFYDRGIFLRYGNHSSFDLRSWSWLASYTIRESQDRKEFEMVNETYKNVVYRCPNFGRIEEEKQATEQKKRKKEEERKREEEEKRRQEELEKTRIIQEQVDRENKASLRDLSRVQEALRQEQSLRARQQQQSQVLQHILKGPAAHVDRDELGDVQGQFEELLSMYEITENENSTSKLEDRMKTLQNELTLTYLGDHKNPVGSLWTLDQATGYVDLSLTERFSVLEAVVKLNVERDADLQDPTTGQDKKIEFLFNLQDQLHLSKPTLARRVLVSAFEMTSQLAGDCREMLSLILFNNIWTPTEIMHFIGRISSMHQETVKQILHEVCTYKPGCSLVLAALNDKDPVGYIQDQVSSEVDKDIVTILDEMRDNNYPEQVLSQLHNILQYVSEALSRSPDLTITADLINSGKRQMMSLDLSQPSAHSSLKKILLVLSLAVKECTTFVTTSGEEVRGYFPRLTQLASLLLLLLPQVQDERGCLLEIGTGEGKTCILAMFATIQAVRGLAVDIVTSSPLLAIRDQEVWRKLYSMFGVTSSTVPPPHQKSSSSVNCDKALEDAYRKQVVYGTVSTFAADILRQEFEKNRTRGNRRFECVVVDEVDYMTLDSGVEVTYLSRQASGLRHVEQVLASIWAMVSACRPIEMSTSGEIHWTTRIQSFHKAAKQAVVGSQSEDLSEQDVLLLGTKMGFYSQKDIDAFNEAMSQTPTEHDGTDDAKWNATENILVKVGVEEQYELLHEILSSTDNSIAVDCYSLFNNKAQMYGRESPGGEPDVRMLLLQKGRACEIMSEKTLIDATVDTLKSKIKYSSECTLDSLEKLEGFIVIPSFLREYIENQLPLFVENALKAIRMTLGREYMIDRAPEADAAAFSNDDHQQYDAIIPVDFQASGVLEKNKRWGDGLQQFLEMKHQLAVSQLSNITNYMSNVYFFKRYLSGNGIFGVSGTLGGEAEKAFLERHYKTAIYVIPAHRHKKLVELPAVQATRGTAEWVQLVCNAAETAADRGQVVLIICEDVKTAEELKTKMCAQERRSRQIMMYTISEKHNIEKQNFGRGTIIIATNLGGRGTDIHVQQEVNECGGLFVLLTYFPGSQRVERQAFGRTGRKGNPGMVQMILNQEHLAAAYQGHSLETMRHLREENEVKHLDGLERNELFEIEIKESLFSYFCEFLCDFDDNYTEEEKTDITQKLFKDIPDYFKSYRSKFDYQTALNALKESWAMWLILHERHIGRHDDVDVLREDLTKHLTVTAQHLLRGRSNNFYDFIELAKSRTIMHRFKSKSDYGALSYWRRAAEADALYSAVALYNQAYITINLRKDDSMEKAKRLLEECGTAVDVYLSESTNAMMFYNLSVTKDLSSQYRSTNLQSQMTARMNLFKSWKAHIENSLKTLEHLEKSGGEATTEDSSVYSLSADKDFITTKELMALEEFGLCFIFDVKKKPEFSVDALLCFGLGLLQVAAGILVCTLTGGFASQFGLGLINEGVQDMMHGFRGMMKGGFDWAQWAISKAISIGVSLVFAGFNRIRQVAGFAKSGMKSLVTASKSAAITTMKQCFGQAGKYAVQELGKQGCITAVNYAVEKGLKTLFHNLLEESYRKKVSSMIHENSDLDKVLTDTISYGVSRTAMDQGFPDLNIEERYETELRELVSQITTEVIPNIMMTCTKVPQVHGALVELCGAVRQRTESKELQVVINTLETIRYFKELMYSIPTKFMINHSFIPQLLETMKKLPRVKDDQDERRQLSCVTSLKDELLDNIAEGVSLAFVETCSGLLVSLTTKACTRKIIHGAGTAVSNLLGRADTQGFFENQVYKHQMRESVQHQHVLLSEADDRNLDSYIDEIYDEKYPATALDLHVLTQTDALCGRGIRVVTVDRKGNPLAEDYYPGKDGSTGDIVLRLRKEPEESQQNKGFLTRMKDRLSGKQAAHTGHFEILNRDGSVTPVESQGQNCLYHAVVQATHPNSPDLEQAAADLRQTTKTYLQQNKPRFAPTLLLHRGYNEACQSGRKYAIEGGGRKTQAEARRRFKDTLNQTDIGGGEDAEQIKKHNLGLTGRLHDVKALRRETRPTGERLDNNENRNSSPVEADHIPPRNSIQKVYETLKSEDKLDEFKEKNRGLSHILHEGGNRGLCMEVRAEDHKRALTTGASHQARAVRSKITDVFLSGDPVKLIKMSVIASHPVTSEELRKDADIHTPEIRRTNVNQRNHKIRLSKDGTTSYHNAGSRGLVEGYFRMKVINENQRNILDAWIREDFHHSHHDAPYKNTSEYKELLETLRNSTNK
ncbi:uncharacterized protein LOC133444499 isoform X1 [Cololabis saira]|uniref:uncharacterized protein LOC133444499 isoform X1 n=1 Tax=Cololabis saira TaxID=129043 RepID=UPI002AD1FA2A|nr:uncharacterized protein LOC133444499 isoform X1 [Cololabis saira]XP_061578315.1 uncharacterized protein LOC133444499 isoform X1 [Cololabis saira]